MSKEEKSEEEAPYKEVTTGQEVPEKEGLLEELERLRKAGETSTARYEEVLKEVQIAFGTGENNPFGTNDVDALKKKIKKMTLSGLHDFSRKVGINPFYDRPTLVENIIKEFHRFQSRTNIFTAPLPVPVVKLDPEDPEHKQILEWLNP